MRIIAGVNLCQRAQDGVRTEDQIGAGGGIFHFTAGAIASGKQLIGFVGRLPLRVHIQQVHEEISAQHALTVGEHAVLAAIKVGTQYAQAADQHRQFWRSQRQLLGFINQQRLRGGHIHLRTVVAETIGNRFEQVKHLDIRLILTRINAARRERYGDIHTCRFCGLLNAYRARQHDDIGQRGFVGGALDSFQGWQRANRRSVHVPVTLRRQRQTRAVGTATLIAAAEGRG